MSKTIGNNVKARNTHPTKLFTNNIPYFFHYITYLNLSNFICMTVTTIMISDKDTAIVEAYPNLYCSNANWKI